MVILDWAYLAACGDDPDRLFVEGARQHQAKQVCSGCLVRRQCLAEALDNRTEHGVWGGLTERERRALLRRHPAVRNWHAMLGITPAA
jgi:WhiB family redox-sensing transcriptional regulator